MKIIGGLVFLVLLALTVAIIMSTPIGNLILGNGFRPEDTIHTINLDASAGPITITLPTASPYKTFKFTKMDDSKNEVIINAGIMGKGNTVTVVK